MTTSPDTPAGPARPAALVNGEPYPLDGPVPVTDLVARLVPEVVVDGVPRGVAVAVDDAVVPRGAWDRTEIRPGMRVEVVTAVQGG
ncbi:sulfur carrier protein ThiS [Myceligenerans salitolerans]|uniref:Sulfur carrier protein ThiS n=1 Tax=Myceligenerans salitolerans TaxID=1230528 RepID=A0ABS3I5K1_9MICO|nr:sulfur carrier protein ThiS [Myceligenerans salitolerans]MBO0608299.1 sulfur carrier protein ThiS [Myceligenerans salitolerans]